LKANQCIAWSAFKLLQCSLLLFSGRLNFGFLSTAAATALTQHQQQQPCDCGGGGANYSW